MNAPHGPYFRVVRDADRERPRDVEEIADPGSRVRGRRMRPEDTGVASMAITSLGGIGGESFSPIVTPSEVAILGLARIEMRPIRDGESFRPRPVAPLDLCYDDRVVNGADAARILSRYRKLVADPSGSLIGT